MLILSPPGRDATSYPALPRSGTDFMTLQVVIGKLLFHAWAHDSAVQFVI
jgi:hypothetical protein